MIVNEEAKGDSSSYPKAFSYPFRMYAVASVTMMNQGATTAILASPEQIRVKSYRCGSLLSDRKLKYIL